jgi:two-component system, OmpR family, alkaline phosphatase synthesis response regulator PhoP
LSTDAIQILVVEDDSDVREAVIESLLSAGYRVGWASNGEEALRKLRAMTSHPRLILLDLMMPVVDGWQFRAEQLADPTIAGVPVVAMTARREVQGLSVHGYLKKPIDLAALLAAVRPHCAQGT